MSEPVNPAMLARFLQENPRFLEEHAELFASIQVPHPTQAHAISLGERQILILRDKIKLLEMRLATLGHQASFNETVAKKLHQWSLQILAEPDADRLPDHIVTSLGNIFELTEVALRVWGLDTKAPAICEPVDDAARNLADSLEQPFCGPLEDSPLQTWFQKPVQSVAALPLRHPAQQDVFGLLVLGSDDPERYTADMATDFLQTIGEVASATLIRMALSNQPHHDEPSEDQPS